MLEGHLEAGVTSCGQGIGLIKETKSANQIIKDIEEELSKILTVLLRIKQELNMNN
jgi:NAD(P)H-dependent flavin oxidoreductase YrpB (nitropropane dioxygenase family)